MVHEAQPRFLHLVRHGEVENPDHVVYADLAGFGLSGRGVSQAEAAADYLAPAPGGAGGYITFTASPGDGTA